MKDLWLAHAVRTRWDGSPGCAARAGQLPVLGVDRPITAEAPAQLLAGRGHGCLRWAVIGVPRQDWARSGLVGYLAGLPTGQVWTGSPVAAQWR
jgi:hypothetical protein